MPINTEELLAVASTLENVVGSFKVRYVAFHASNHRAKLRQIRTLCLIIRLLGLQVRQRGMLSSCIIALTMEPRLIPLKSENCAIGVTG